MKVSTKPEQDHNADVAVLLDNKYFMALCVPDKPVPLGSKLL